MERTNSKQDNESSDPKASSANERNTNSVNPSLNKKSEVIPPSASSNERKECSENTELYKKVFKAYYARLCDSIPVQILLPHLLSNDIITMQEMEDIRVERTTFCQAQALLNGPIWRAINGGYPKAFVMLLCVLCCIRSCESLCKDIYTELDISAEVISSETRKLTAKPYHLQLTTGMSKYCQQLKNKYTKLSLCSPEELLECKSSRYVNLVLTKFDKKLKKEREELVSGQLNSIMLKRSRLSSVDITPLTLADVLNVKEEENKVILIEGGPGMGKSTLAIKICKCWADGELLEEYDAVILLPLRDPEIQAAKSIKDLLLVLDDELIECVYKEIAKTNGEGICFLLEGFDELPHHLRTSSIFSRLAEKLSKCTLIYTSRPEACNQLRSIASHKIEILGFKEEQVDEYINNAFENVEDGKKKAVKLTALSSEK